jgi:hypothetical protein
LTGNVINIGDVSRYGATENEWAQLSMVMGHTEDLLPVVSNPKATIAKTSSLKEVGKVPSQYNYAKEVVGVAAWTSKFTADGEITRWSNEPDYSIFMQTRIVRAIDVDVADREKSALIRTTISNFLGINLPERNRSNSGKFLLAVIITGTLPKRSFPTDGGIVEFLGDGNGFVCAGRHPSGVRYEWPDGFPPEFPTITAEQFELLWSELIKHHATGDAISSSASQKSTKLHAAIAADPVATYLIESGTVKRTERDGRLHITCPFESSHTTEGGDSATTYWPAFTGGYKHGHFDCKHAHCSHRTDADFKDAIGYVNADILNEFDALLDSPDAVIPTSAKPVTADTVEEGGTVGDGFMFSDLSGDFPDEPAVPREAVKPKPTTPAGEKLDRFHVYQPQDLLRMPRAKWLIKGVLPRGDLVVIFGESGSGKSFFVLDIALALTRGHKWRGKRVTKSRVVYVAAEGASGIPGRLMAYCKYHNLDYNDINLGVIRVAPNMLERGDAVAISKQILMAGGADVVIMDTWAQVTAGANENSGEDMGAALANCKGITKATGATIVLVHHSGKDSSKGARGWSGLRAAADGEIEISRDANSRMATVTKLKEGEDGQEFGFGLVSTVLGEDEDGDDITSMVLVEEVIPVRGPAKEQPKGPWQLATMRAVQDLTDELNRGPDRFEIVTRVKSQTPVDASATGADRRTDNVARALLNMVTRNILRIEDDKYLIL